MVIRSLCKKKKKKEEEEASVDVIGLGPNPVTSVLIRRRNLDREAEIH